MKEKRTRRFQLLLTQSEYAAIQTEAEGKGLTASDVIRLAVREYLKSAVPLLAYKLDGVKTIADRLYENQKEDR